jgi:hypothetical protein
MILDIAGLPEDEALDRLQQLGVIELHDLRGAPRQ